MLNGNISSVSGAVNTSGDNVGIDTDAQFGSSDTKNIAIGGDSLDATLIGATENIAIGYNSGGTITAGDYNVLIGAYAGDGFETSHYNVAIGRAALSGALTTAANGTVAIGYASATTLTTGTENTAIGFETLDAETVGKGNTAIGYRALSAQNGAGDSADTFNTVIGAQAGQAITTSVQNVVIGYKAMLEHTIGHSNTVIGYQAMSNTNDSAGTLGSSHNVFIGNNSGSGIWGNGAGGGLSCDKNVALGNSTLSGALNNADDNTAIGYQAGNSITTGTQNVLIGSGTDTSAVGGTNQIVIGKGVTCTGDNTATLGIGSNTISIALDGSTTTWSAASSDERLKENIKSCDVGLAFINDLRPVTYNWKKAKDVPKDMPQYVEGSEEPVLGFNYGVELHGFIAQEVKEAIDKHDDIKDSFKMWQLKDDGTQTVADGAVMPMLIKAIQELSQQIEDLKKG
jgi:hypothetical protein